MKTKKIDRDFLLSDSTVNVYGFRLLTAGYLIDEFKKNPIGYYMHDREDGVIVRWEDLRIDGDKIYGKPVINLSNERGQQCVDEIENSFLNGASVGHIVALEWSEDPSMMLPGQTGPTITKWYNRECSLCDVPGNMNALALYDKEGNVINLADFKTKSPLNMKQVILTAAQLSLIPNLKANPEQADVDTAFADLVAKAGKVDTLTQNLAAANTEKEKAINDLAAFKKSGNEAAVKDLIDTAVTDTKITKEAGEALKVQYANNPDGLKNLLATFQPYRKVKEDLKAGETELEKMSWSELDKAGKLEDLKAANIEVFKDKYKAEFKKEYTESK